MQGYRQSSWKDGLHHKTNDSHHSKIMKTFFQGARVAVEVIEVPRSIFFDQDVQI